MDVNARIPASSTPRPAPESAERVAPELSYSVEHPSTEQRSRDSLEAARQWKRSELAPGTYLARQSDGGKKGIRQLRLASEAEQAVPVEGLRQTLTGWESAAVANPGDPEGRFDPLAYAPRIVFDPKEDSYPLIPDLDGDGNPETDVDHYRHGVIGGDQPLVGSVNVSRKGEYTVLTYSQYYADNKFTNYHRSDSSTFAVYLKPDKAGKLEPAYLYTSWHYGANLAKWDDLKKDADGRPVVKVERGSHALHPYGKGESLPTHGLQITGDGQVEKDGQPLDHRMDWVTPSPNVRNARYLDPADRANKTVLNAFYEHYPERVNPIHPVLFEAAADKNKGPLQRALDWIKGLF